MKLDIPSFLFGLNNGIGSVGYPKNGELGRNASILHSYDEAKVFLKDSGFNDWTPTTAETTLDNGVAYEALTLDTTNNDFIVFGKWHTHFEYANDADEKARIEDLYSKTAFGIRGYTNTIANMGTETISGIIVDNNPIGVNIIDYFNSSGTHAITVGSAGVYPQWLTPTASVTGIIAKTPIVKGKCGAASFSTTSAGKVDKTRSYYEYKIDVWKVDKWTSIFGKLIEDSVKMWKEQNG